MYIVSTFTFFQSVLSQKINTKILRKKVVLLGHMYKERVKNNKKILKFPFFFSSELKNSKLYILRYLLTYIFENFPTPFSEECPHYSQDNRVGISKIFMSFSTCYVYYSIEWWYQMGPQMNSIVFSDKNYGNASNCKMKFP